MLIKQTSRFIVIVLLSFISFFVIKIALDYKPKAKLKAIEGLKCPEYSFQSVKGETFSSDSLKGYSVFINFWATWCKPCIDELPSIQKLYDLKKSDSQFKMVLVLYNESTKKALSFMEKNNYDFPVFIDHNARAARAFGLTGVPETYIIDKEGFLFKKFIGPVDWNSEESLKLIDKVIKK